MKDAYEDHVEVENGLCICTALPHCFLEWLCECALLCLLKRGFRPWIVTTSLVDCLVSHKRTVASIGSWHSYQFKRPSSPCIRFLYMTTIKDRRRRDFIIPPSSFFSSSAWCTYVLPRLLILRNQLSTTPLIFQDYVRHFISNHWTRLISLSSLNGSGGALNPNMSLFWKDTLTSHRTLGISSNNFLVSNLKSVYFTKTLRDLNSYDEIVLAPIRVQARVNILIGNIAILLLKQR